MADKLMRTFVVMSFFMVMALFSDCGTHETSLTDTDNGRKITVKTGDAITLTLDSNPTTGCSRQVMEVDNAVLDKNGDLEYKRAPGTEDLVGAGSIEIIPLKPLEQEKLR